MAGYATAPRGAVAHGKDEVKDRHRGVRELKASTLKR
jgi:hypothetical protein